MPFFCQNVKFWLLVTDYWLLVMEKQPVISNEFLFFLFPDCPKFVYEDIVIMVGFFK